MSNNLSEYVRKVLDTNNDGVVNIKDIISLFPNHATAIAILFVDAIVLAAEYRVWDIGLQMTGDPLKAVGFVLVSAVPFILGQIFWLNPTANTIQKWIAVGMVASSLYTSWVFGTADLSQNYDVTVIVSTVTNLTAIYIVATMGYILLDNGIKANRLKKEAEGRARQEAEYQDITRKVLRELAKTMELQRETEKEFGDAALVQAQLDRVRGVKPKPTQAPAFQRQFANTTELPDSPKEQGQERP